MSNLLLLLALSSATAGVGEFPHCKLSVHSVATTGKISPAPFLTADHFRSVELSGDQSDRAKNKWLLVLTFPGAAINMDYVRQHPGQKLAVRCDGKTVAIQSVNYSHDQYIPVLVARPKRP
jgi:hypothetical protein